MRKQDSATHLLRKIRTLATMDSISVLAVSLAAAAISLLTGHWLESAFCLAAAAAGALEWQGVKSLDARTPWALHRMQSAQILLLFVILAYCGWRLATVSAEGILERVDQTAVAETMRTLYPDRALLEKSLGITLKSAYVAIMLLAAIFQGGLWMLYRKGRRTLCPPQPPTQPDNPA